MRNDDSCYKNCKNYKINHLSHSIAFGLLQQALQFFLIIEIGSVTKVCVTETNMTATKLASRVVDDVFIWASNRRK